MRGILSALVAILSVSAMAAVIADMRDFKLVDTLEIIPGIHEGGLSGLTHIAGDPADIIYGVSDRGINGEAEVDGEKRRTFPAPGYGPTIFKIKLEEGNARILERIRLSIPAADSGTTESRRISGLPNVAGLGEEGYDATGRHLLEYDPHGLDIEGIAHNPADDTFWLCDEYGPSLVHVRRNGEVIERLVPQGLAARLGTTYARDALPALYSSREDNRGFEGIAVSPSGNFLFTAFQSPLENPKKKTANNSRQARILKLDLKTLKPAGEFVYATEDGAMAGLRQRDLMLSDLVALDDTRLIVDERDNQAGASAKIKRLYLIDTAPATNVLGTPVARQAKGDTLEAMTPKQLAQHGIVPVAKTLLVDLVGQGYRIEKLEGVCLVDPQTLVIAQDNDFAIDYEGDRKIHTRIQTQLTVIRLKEPLY